MMDLAKIFSLITSVASVVGSGPWGAIGLVSALGVVGGAILYAIRKANSARDTADLEAGGADAGRTAVDMKNQMDANNAYIDEERERIKKEGPPK